MTPTFILYLITLSVTDGAEVSRHPVAPARETEMECLLDQQQDRAWKPQRAYVKDGHALIDVYECVRRDEVSKL